ncbi:chromatin binding protein [Coelomomyces lativittatus]|nr:chromatin binding protein [Coelomomyces lativittatus]
MIHTMVDTSLPSFPHLIEFTIPDTSVIAVYFNKKGNHLAGCCNNGYLLIWDVATMTLLRSLHGHAAAVTCASWSKSGRYLASGGLDHKCLLWDITSSKILHEFEFDVPIIHVAIHPHQRYFISFPLLQTHRSFLHQKLCLMALVDFVFRHHLHHPVPMTTLLHHLPMSMDSLEHMIMKACSLNLVKASMDQVHQTVLFTWVVPRVLDRAQLADMIKMLDTWKSKVQSTVALVEQHAKELVHEVA